MATNTVTMLYDFHGLCLCFIWEMSGEGEEGKLLEVTALFIYMCLCAHVRVVYMCMYAHSYQDRIVCMWLFLTDNGRSA